MNRLIVLTIAVITLCNTTWGQSHIVADSIKVQIAKKDSLITSNTLKKDVLIESLNAQICDYKQLFDVYEELISEKNANNDGLQVENKRLKGWLALIQAFLLIHLRLMIMFHFALESIFL